MPLSPSITESAVLTLLRAFLLAIVPSGVEVIKSQANRVPEPVGPNFVMMTPNNRLQLSTAVETWDQTNSAPVVEAFAHSTQFSVQLDFHGPNGSDYASAFVTLFRSPYGCRTLDPAGAVQPLFCSDGHQMPFVNAQRQYEDRWVVTAEMQFTPSVSTPQDFAATLTPEFIPVPGGLTP